MPTDQPQPGFAEQRLFGCQPGDNLLGIYRTTGPLIVCDHRDPLHHRGLAAYRHAFQIDRSPDLDQGIGNGVLQDPIHRRIRRCTDQVGNHRNLFEPPQSFGRRAANGGCRIFKSGFQCCQSLAVLPQADRTECGESHRQVTIADPFPDDRPCLRVINPR